MTNSPTPNAKNADVAAEVIAADEATAANSNDVVASVAEAAVEPTPVMHEVSLNEAPSPEPPRPLVAGAFLRQEFEIKELLSRGMTNIYAAQSGDYGATVAKLIAERDVPKPASNEPTPFDGQSTEKQTINAEAAVAIAESATGGTPVEAPATIDDAAGSGAFVEDVDTLSGTPLPAPTLPEEDEGAMATGGESLKAEIENEAVFAPIAIDDATPDAWDTPADFLPPLLPPHETFVQDEREYAVFDFVATQALQDYREPTNDERLLSMLTSLANGLRELEARNRRAELTTETLRVAEEGRLIYIGFTDAPPQGQSANGLEQLRNITSFLLKRVFAESATMRLDDEFGSLPFCEEVKEIARQISEGEFKSVAEASDAINRLKVSTRLRVQSALLSDVGRERELNEDSGMIVNVQRAAHLGSRELELYVVADGMGGHEGGEVASDLTMTSLQKHLDAHSHIDWNDNVAVRSALVAVIDAVNTDVVALTETPKYKGTRAKPGSTLVFAIRLGARVFVGNVGDSRAYKYSGGILQRISKDHSYVQTLIDRGEITDEEAFDHPEGSVITAHIGYPKLRQRDVFLRWFSPGDRLLLVSDGVTDMLRDREYEPHLQHDDPADVCRGLVDASNAAGGADNITVVCVDFR